MQPCYILITPDAFSNAKPSITTILSLSYIFTYVVQWSILSKIHVHRHNQIAEHGAVSFWSESLNQIAEHGAVSFWSESLNQIAEHGVVSFWSESLNQIAEHGAVSFWSESLNQIAEHGAVSFWSESSNQIAEHGAVSFWSESLNQIAELLIVCTSRKQAYFELWIGSRINFLHSLFSAVPTDFTVFSSFYPYCETV